MSVDPVRLNQQFENDQRLTDDGAVGAATDYATQHFEKMMRSDSSGQTHSEAFTQKLNTIDKLLSAEPSAANRLEIENAIQSAIAQGIKDGSLDVASLPDAGDGSGLKQLTENLYLDPSDGSVLVRDGDTGGYQPLSTVDDQRMQSLGAQIRDIVTDGANPSATEASGEPTAATDTSFTAAAIATVEENPEIKHVVTQQALAPHAEMLETGLERTNGPFDTRGLSAQQIRSTVTTLIDSGEVVVDQLPPADGNVKTLRITPNVGLEPESGELVRYEGTTTSDDGGVSASELTDEQIRQGGQHTLDLAYRSAQGAPAADVAPNDPVPEAEVTPDGQASSAADPDAAYTENPAGTNYTRPTTGPDGSIVLPTAADDNPEAAAKLEQLRALIDAYSPENDNSGAILDQIHVVAREMAGDGHGEAADGALRRLGGGDNADNDAGRFVDVTDQIRLDTHTNQLQIQRMVGREDEMGWVSLSELRGDPDAILSLGRHVSGSADAEFDPTKRMLGDYGNKLNSDLHAPGPTFGDDKAGLNHEQLTAQGKLEMEQYLAMAQQDDPSRGDLKAMAKAGIRYAYGELGLPIKEHVGPMLDLNRWIEATSVDDLKNFGASEVTVSGERNEYTRYQGGSEAAKEHWLSLSKAERLAHFDLDVESWDRVQPYVETADTAWQMQRAMKTNYGMMAVMVVGSIVTAGALTAAMPAMAATIGTAGANAVSTTLVSGLVTGDWEGAIKSGVTSYVGGAAGDYASAVTSSQVGQFAIEAGVNGALEELNGGDFKDGVVATGADYLPRVSANVADSMGIEPGTWQHVAYDGVVSGVNAELNGGDFGDGFRSGATRSAGEWAGTTITDTLEIDNPYLETVIRVGANGAAYEFADGEFEDGARYTAYQQLPMLNAALHEQFDAEQGSFLSTILTAGTTGVGYELRGESFADGFWNSTADSLAAYVDDMDKPEDTMSRMLIDAGAAGIIGEMRDGDFDTGFLRVVGSYAGEAVGDEHGATAGATTEVFIHRLIENGGNVQDALLVAGRTAVQNNNESQSADADISTS